jgi:hypothetical protein
VPKPFKMKPLSPNQTSGLFEALGTSWTLADRGAEPKPFNMNGPSPHTCRSYFGLSEVLGASWLKRELINMHDLATCCQDVLRGGTLEYATPKRLDQGSSLGQVASMPRGVQFEKVVRGAETLDNE